MGLIKCPECEREVSDQAAHCPGCGYPLAERRPTEVAPAPPPKAKTSGCSVALLVVLSLFLFGLLVNIFSGGGGNGRQSEKVFEQAASPAYKATRLELIRKAKKAGIVQWTKQQGNDFLELRTGPTWDVLSFDQKKGLAVSYYVETFGTSPDGYVTITDYKTGKEIGRFTKYGLEIY